MENNQELIYCLYADKEQTKLLAMAYSEEQLKEVTKQYTGGIWFEYDHVDDKFLENERLYGKRIKFPSEVVKEEKIISEVKEFKWIS